MNSATNEITVEHHLRELKVNIEKCSTMYIEFWGLLSEDIPGKLYFKLYFRFNKIISFRW
jgi:hypothetical protein